VFLSLKILKRTRAHPAVEHLSLALLKFSREQQMTDTTPPLISTAIFLAVAASKGRKPTIPFSQRGLTNLSQSVLTEVFFSAVPHEKQFAYMGYKESIEAFIAATIFKRKILTSAPSCPIGTPHWSTPLPLPPVVFQFKEKPSDKFIGDFKEKLDAYGLGSPAAGKGPPLFTLATPTVTLLLKTLPAICQPRCLIVEGHTQLSSFMAIAPVYAAIDSFLATHTYEYKGTDPEYTSSERACQPGSLETLMEIRHGQNWFRTGWNSEKRVKSLEKDYVPERVDDAEERDLSHTKSYMINPLASVYVAKPSPLPSSVNFGPSTQVPYKNGLLFPYFPGMLAADSAFLRQQISSLFLRNLGSETVTPRQAFKELCEVLGPFANTEAGIVMTHVLSGVRMALDSQSILYLIFNDSNYKGYCLLGEKFSVFCHGKWVEPMPAEKLRASLALVQTRKSSLDEIHTLLLQCVDTGGDTLIVEREKLESLSYLADCLAKVDISKEECPKDKLSEALAQCSFPSRFLTFKPVHIVNALISLTDPTSTPLYDKNPFYIPIKGWSGINTHEYKVLACFGAKSFSFRNAKGDEFRIPAKTTDKDPLAETGEKGEVHKKILIGEKPVRDAISDWKQFLNKGSLRMDLVERAGDQRLHSFVGKAKDAIWDCLKGLASSGKIVSTGEEKKSEKRSFEAAFGTGTMDDSFQIEV